MDTNLHKQGQEPLFKDIFWNRPLNRRTAKKLLIIGGHSKQFSQTQTAYQAALAAGIGQAKVVLPEGVRTYIKGAPDCLYVAQTKSGSLAKAAYSEIAGFIKECDGVLLAGEFSHNSETTSLLEQILSETTKPLIMGADVVERLLFNPTSLATRQNRVLLAPTQLLLKLAAAFNLELNANAGIAAKTELLTGISKHTGLEVILLGHELLIQSGGQTSLTQVDDFPPELFGLARSLFATFWLQHEEKFQALTTAAFVLSKISKLHNQGIALSLKNLQQTLSEYAQ